MDQLVAIIGILTVLLLLAAVSPRFGVDSREGFQEHELIRELRALL
ncbi:MAG TPA: hypothetical protein VK009_03745 [Chloroflexota bacterium]|nr:hypothetical protein [Chloroflexota bacterium]